MDTGQPAALRFDTLVEQSPTGVYVVQDERFVYANPQMGRIFGYEPAELLGLASVLDVVHPADRDRVRELLRQRTSGEIDNVPLHVARHPQGRRGAADRDTRTAGTRLRTGRRRAAA